MRKERGQQAEENFKKAVAKHGYSDHVADEIWKWYTCPLKGKNNNSSH